MKKMLAVIIPVFFASSAFAEVAIKATDGVAVGSKGPINGLSGTASLDNTDFVTCPPGSFVAGLQGFTGTGSPLIIHIRYNCRKPSGEETAINGTNGVVAGSKNSIDGLAGTTSLDDTDIVACPTGSFASGLQGFHGGGTAALVWIRYNCRNQQGQETAIKGTIIDVVDGKGPIAGLAGTTSLDNPNIVACPIGSFITGVQGFHSGPGISIIRYLCEK